MALGKTILSMSIDVVALPRGQRPDLLAYVTLDSTEDGRRASYVMTEFEGMSDLMRLIENEVTESAALELLCLKHVRTLSEVSAGDTNERGRKRRRR